MSAHEEIRDPGLEIALIAAQPRSAPRPSWPRRPGAARPRDRGQLGRCPRTRRPQMSLIDTILGRPLASSEPGEHRLIRTILYVNDGDWVHSRTAVVEEQDGTLQVLG